MAMKQNDSYQCPNPDCGCEITVTKASHSEMGDMAPRCCCGEDMELTDKKRVSAKGRSRQEASR